MAIDEAQHALVVLHRPDETPFNRDLTAQPGNDLRLYALAVCIRQRLALLSAEGLSSSIMLFDEAGGAVNDFERRLVACLVIIVPGTHPVMAEQNALGLRVVFNQLLYLQPDVETRALPGDIDKFVAVNFFAKLFLVDGSGDSDDRIRVQVVNVLVGNES